MIQVCVVGAGGRMGRLLLAALSDHPGASLSGAIVAPNSPLAGQPTGYGEVTFDTDLGRAAAEAQLVLDFSVATHAESVAATCARHGTPLLVGTTGHTPEATTALRRHGERIPLALIPNTSLGGLALRHLARLARSILGADFDVSILDLHHRQKKDAPSGTAHLLATELNPDGNGRRPDIASIRGGDVPGEHTLFFLGPAERIELTHRVRDRAVFAHGAIRLGLALIGRPCGIYGADDLVVPAQLGPSR